MVSVAVGCTGGFHRSVAVAEALAADALSGGLAGTVRVHHRDIARR
jgi:RNase adaptor protein for sRNA GlmZ degradation